MKVLLIYPNMPLQYSLPHSIAKLSSCLKELGNEVRLFDTTMYKPTNKTDEEKRIERGQLVPYKPQGIKNTDMIEDFRKYIEDFNPDKLMITYVDNTISIGTKLLQSLNKHIHTTVGGVSAILEPGRFNNPLYDVIWDKTAEEMFFPNNPSIELMDDWTIFESDRLYRPMSGKYYKTIPILTDNGCPYNCGFCCAPRLRKKLKYKSKPIKNVERELKYQINLHNPEFIYFSSETFFSMSMNKFREFSELYKQYRLPFWCQTHINTITEERVKLLKDMNCHKVALGIECGNENYRKKMIGKNFTNEQVINAFKLLKRYDIIAASNNIVGLPLETLDNMKETVELNKKLYNIMPDAQFNCYVYQPYYGTRLRDLCVQNNLLRDEPDTVIGDPVIKSPYITDMEIKYIRDSFQELIRV